ncbi:hypothetical protein NE237_006052 [Protea cynaroides]|uniref:Uncharacterized protein n=1 Tax=Protea cynaroides TaxID=273540 RepID=A0A9Q0KLM5_9MAGN|nr:hypothetical protein NE237_006052 [Protea cynaroides]
MGMSESFQDNLFDYIFKTILIGDSGVGKSNLLSRFVWDKFRHDSKPTIGVEFAYSNTQIDEKLIKTQIWDTAGQERFRAFTSSYYRGALGALLVYDITQRPTFNNLAKWLMEIRDYGDSDMVIALVGNKIDLGHSREVSREEGQSFAEKEGLCFMETSALENLNVGEAFLELITQIYKVTSKKSLDAEISQAQITPLTSGKTIYLDQFSETEEMTGDSGVGKSNLLSRFVWDKFCHDSKPTIGVEFAYSNTQIDEKLIKTKIWDTAGQERFRAFTSSYYRGALGALLVYDITRRPTFDNLAKWLMEIREFGDSDMVIALVGNKIEMGRSREVSREEGQSFAEKEGLCFMETSALENLNVGEAFLELITRIYEVTSKKSLDAETTQAQIITLTSGKTIYLDQFSETEERRCCC